MKQFKAAWERFAADEANLTELFEDEATSALVEERRPLSFPLHSPAVWKINAGVIPSLEKQALQRFGYDLSGSTKNGART